MIVVWRFSASLFSTFDFSTFNSASLLASICRGFYILLFTFTFSTCAFLAPRAILSREIANSFFSA
jgi:hypothetical protein